MSSLKTKKEVPSTCTSTYDFGSEVECMKGLTLPEMIMISPIIAKVHVLKLVCFGDPASAQRGIKGNSVCFMQDIKDVAQRLPLPEFAICEQLKVVFIGDSTCQPHYQKIKKILRVRRQKVEDALRFLCNNHEGFKKLNITVDEEVLRSLPEDDVPDSILNNVSYSHDVDQANEEETDDDETQEDETTEDEED